MRKPERSGTETGSEKMARRAWGWTLWPGALADTLCEHSTGAPQWGLENGVGGCEQAGKSAGSGEDRRVSAVVCVADADGMLVGSGSERGSPLGKYIV